MRSSLTKYCAFSSPVVLFFAMTIAGCTIRNAGNTEDFVKEISGWKERRLTRLKSENGWLTLCGLFWLRIGENPVGTDSTAAIVLPKGKAPLRVGSIRLEGGRTTFVAAKSADVRLHDSTISTLVLQSDQDGDPTVLTTGRLSFYVIKRGDQLGVRVKDKDNPARLQFSGLEYFPADPAWRVEAAFEPYVPKKVLIIPSITGTVETDTCPGALVFQLRGHTLRLDAVIEKGSEDQLFIMFSDETSGKETYAVGRQLYSSLPDGRNRVMLDFNKAYNWPCVFTVYATCPIPPRQNHLPIRVEAGEKMYGELH